MSNLEEKLEKFAETVNNRLSVIEERIANQHLAHERTLEECNLPPNFGQRGASLPPPPLLQGAASSTDTQGEFQSLKDSLNKVKLPADVKLNDSRQGIKRTDQPLLNILSKCGRYSETAIKLLCTLEAGTELTQGTLDNLFLIQHAQIKYLQEEYASLLVSGQFDSSTAKIFRSLQKNTSGFDHDSLETLRAAATLSAAGRPTSGNTEDRYPSRRGGFSGYGRGRQRGSYGGRSQDRDVFQTFTNRSFPRRQFRGDNNAHDNHDEAN